MKIEFIELPGDDYFTHYLCIDGDIDIKSGIHKKTLHPSDESIKLLGNVPIKELSEFFTDIHYSAKADWSDWEFAMRLILSKDAPSFLENYDPEPVYLLLACNIDYINWRRHYSIHQLQQAFEEVLSSRQQTEYYFDPTGQGIFGIIIRPDNQDITLEALALRAIEIAEPVQKEAMELVAAMVAPDVITTLFDFPEEIKTACKQYLLYFAQFLADVGIKVGTEIKETAGKVLFTVVPEDANVALDNIKKALRLYMEAPGSSPGDSAAMETDKEDIAIMRWQSAVHYLRSQLSLAQAELQAKNATIEYLNLSLYVSKQAMLPNVQMDVMPRRPRDEEPIVEGVLSVRKYDLLPGLSLDLPQIFRALKKLFGFKT